LAPRTVFLNKGSPKIMSRLVSSLLCAGLLGLTPALAAEAQAQEHDLTGDWEFTVQSPNGTGTRDVTFAQDGDVLLGTVASSQASGDFTGTVEGDQVTFAVNLVMNSGVFTVTYRATVTGEDEMEGTIDFGDYGQGTFTGRRSEPADPPPATPAAS